MPSRPPQDCEGQDGVLVFKGVLDSAEGAERVLAGSFSGGRRVGTFSAVPLD